MIIDLRQGFGDFEEYKLTKFPDNSIKFELKEYDEFEEEVVIETTFRTSDDIIALGLVSETIRNVCPYAIQHCTISYMMYQQDDRKFKKNESFGLKFICTLLNSYSIDRYEIFHPHSDKVEFIEGLSIMDNTQLIDWATTDIYTNKKDLIPLVWVIPDAGAFKTQFKQIEKTYKNEFITCMKSRDHATGEIVTVVNTDDLRGKDCFIVDDICLGGATFIKIAEELKKKNCGKLFLIVSHGVFNKGTDNLLHYFDGIYTTDSIYTDPSTDKVKVLNL